jgi:hypothetical protein
LRPTGRLRLNAGKRRRHHDGKADGGRRRGAQAPHRRQGL